MLSKGIFHTIVFLQFILFIAFYLYLVFEYPLGFNYNPETARQYYLLSGALLSLLLGCFFFWLKAALDRVDLLLIGFFVLNVILGISVLDRVENEFLVVVYSSWVFLVMLFQFNVSRMVSVRDFILLVFFLQILLAFYQIVWQGQFSEMSSTTANGSFGNSGIFSIYLVTHLPIVHFTFFAHKNKNMRATGYSSRRKRILIDPWGRFIYFLALIVVLFISVINNSRTTVLVIPIMFCVLHWKGIYPWIQKVALLGKSRFRYFAFLTFVVLIYFFSKYLFELKLASSNGRLLIWKISLNNIGDCWFKGIGLGQFHFNYPEWQAKFLGSSVDLSDSFYFSANESYVAFSEPLHFFIELGLGWFAACTVTLAYFFSAKSGSSLLHKTLKNTVLCILLCSLFYYTLHCIPILIICFFCVGWGIKMDKRLSLACRKTLKKGVSRAIFGLLTIISLILFAKSIELTFTVNRWQSLQLKYTTFSADKEEEMLALYQDLYESLYQDPKFLIMYGEFLMQNRTYMNEAIKCFEEARRSNATYRLIENLANCYYNTADFPNAIRNYYWLSNLIPSKFGPKFGLLKCYDKLGNKNKVHEYADIIDRMPVKIPSAEVRGIKMSSRIILKRNL